MKISITILFLILGSMFASSSMGQKKSATLGLHFFYNDFPTAYQVKTTSLKNVLSNNLWTKMHNMQDGLAVTYRKGLTKKIDWTGTAEFSYIDYLSQSGIYNGSNEFLFATQVTAVVKMFEDKKALVPYLTAGIGGSVYDGKFGAYIPAGLGIQFNIFSTTFLYTDFQYRTALSNQVSNHFNYSVGVASTLKKQKVKEKPVVEIPVVTTMPVEEKYTAKNITVKVTDEATGFVLEGVELHVRTSDAADLILLTNDKGEATFTNTNPAEYSIYGSLHNISTNIKSINKELFKGAAASINVALVHNDPRFSLQGVVLNSSTNAPEAGVEVTVTDIGKGSNTKIFNDPRTGTFNVQLEPNSSYSIVGKKASYLSNIGNASTEGLNRSTTLYLQLELQVQEVSTAKNIVLSNIYFATGKTSFDVASSTDLQKLVQFLNDNLNTQLEIQGHTDNVGSVAGNKKLSEQRALSIVNYLVSKGIDKARLTAKGYGSTLPIESNATEDGRAKNRRVEMKLIK